MSKTPKFEIHFNRELGKKYYSKRDYVSDMKKAGLEPYRGEIKQPERKPYERSEWAREMHRDIKDRKGRAPGDRFISELEKRGFTQKRADEARRLAG